MLFGASVLFARSDADAEPFHPRAERVLPPGKSTATEDGADALVVNPGNLPHLPGQELRYQFVRCPETGKVNCGHAVAFATPLFLGLTTGLRVDYVTPPAGVDGPGFPFDSSDYTWLTWGVGFAKSRTLSFGASVQWAYSSNPYIDGTTTMNVGMTYRPSTRFAFALVGQDFFASTRALTPIRVPVVGPGATAALAFRPTGTRALELGVEARAFFGEGVNGKIRPRALVAFDIPGVGRARGDVEADYIANDDRRGVIASAGLELAIRGFSVGGGAIFGSGLGSPSSVGQFGSVSFTSWDNPGLPKAERAVFIRMEGTPGPRSHVHLIRRLWELADDNKVAAVTMVMRAEPSSSFAHAEELADAFRVLRARGKKVMCSWERAGQKAIYACASADRIVINPAGELRYAGLKTTYVYLAGLLSKLGIKAEIVRIGAHKSAPEQFTNEKASDVVRADQEDMLANVDAVFTKNLELYRKMSPQKLREVTKKGPFIASEARDAGFVDGYAYDDEIERATQDLVGRKVSFQRDVAAKQAPKWFGPRSRVALLYVDGEIIDGRSRTIPLLGNKLNGSYTIAETAKQLREDPTVKSVVLRIESPGGSSLGSDVIWRELKLLAAKKPLIVSMGSMAASGGYYIAAPATKIYALPLTVTGSIGVFFGKADISELLRKIGVNTETRKTSPTADTDSMYRGFSAEERKELEHKVGQFYDLFLSRVAEGRKISKAEVDAAGQGRVWAGQQAVEHKLVDKIGGLREALAEARRMGNLPDDAPVVEVPQIETSLIERVIGLAGLRAFEPVSLDQLLPVGVRDVARSLSPFMIHNESEALMRLEWTDADAPWENDDDSVFTSSGD